jgi:IclR family acetate operon transcriptional repressor
MLGSWAMPLLEDLVQQTGETANLAMMDSNEVVYVAQVPSRHTVRMFTEVGKHVPLHCTGVGKALLSTLSDDQVTAILTRTGMPPSTDSTITSLPVMLAELERIRERGYALDDGEQEVGVRCIAVPVEAELRGFAVSISGPASRMVDEVVQNAAPHLMKAAGALRSQFALTPPS